MPYCFPKEEFPLFYELFSHLGTHPVIVIHRVGLDHTDTASVRRRVSWQPGVLMMVSWTEGPRVSESVHVGGHLHIASDFLPDYQYFRCML